LARGTIRSRRSQPWLIRLLNKMETHTSGVSRRLYPSGTFKCLILQRPARLVLRAPSSLVPLGSRQSSSSASRLIPGLKGTSLRRRASGSVSAMSQLPQSWKAQTKPSSMKKAVESALVNSGCQEAHLHRSSMSSKRLPSSHFQKAASALLVESS